MDAYSYPLQLQLAELELTARNEQRRHAAELIAQHPRPRRPRTRRSGRHGAGWSLHRLAGQTGRLHRHA